MSSIRPSTPPSSPSPSASASAGCAEALLSARRLRAERGDRVLFSGLELALRTGEALHVHGPNGSGKTTLLRSLCGFGRFDDGELHWRGKAIEPGHPDMRRELHFIGHAAAVKLELTPLENLRVCATLQGGPPGLSAVDALERVQLYGFEDVPARILSAGQRRRLALARLLTSHASLWVLDEPFTALDDAGMALVKSLVEEHLAHGGAALVTSHQHVTLDGATLRRLDLHPEHCSDGDPASSEPAS